MNLSVLLSITRYDLLISDYLDINMGNIKCILSIHRSHPKEIYLKNANVTQLISR